MKLVEIPNDSKNVNIGNKKTPGRPSKKKQASRYKI